MSEPENWKLGNGFEYVVGPKGSYAIIPEDLLRVAEKNTIVATVLDAWKAGSFPSLERALIYAVVALADQNELLLRDVTKHLQFEQAMKPIDIDLANVKSIKFREFT